MDVGVWNHRVNLHNGTYGSPADDVRKRADAQIHSLWRCRHFRACVLKGHFRSRRRIPPAPVLENSWLGEGTSVFNGFCPTSLGSQMERKGDKKGKERMCQKRHLQRERWLITVLISEFRLWKWITQLTGRDSREPVFGSFDCSRYYKYFTGFISPERRAGRASHRSKFT